jgi:hypothetical protein
MVTEKWNQRRGECQWKWRSFKEKQLKLEQFEMAFEFRH